MYSTDMKALLLPNGRAISNFDHARISCSAPPQGRTNGQTRLLSAVPQANVSLAVYQRLKRLSGRQDNGGLNCCSGKEIRSRSAQVRTKPEQAEGIGSMDYQNNQRMARSGSGSRDQFGLSNCNSDNRSVNMRANGRGRWSMYDRNEEPTNRSIRDTLPVLGGRQDQKGSGVDCGSDGIKQDITVDDNGTDNESDMFSFHGPEVLTHKLKIEKLKDPEADPFDKKLINVKTISFAPGTILNSPNEQSKDRRLKSYNYGRHDVPKFRTPKATHLVGSGQEAARINRLKFILDRHSRKTDAADSTRWNESAKVPNRGGGTGPSWLYRSKTTVDLTKYQDKHLKLGLIRAMDQNTERNRVPPVLNNTGTKPKEQESRLPHEDTAVGTSIALLGSENGQLLGGTENITVDTNDSGVASETSDRIYTDNGCENDLDRFERKRFPPGGALRDTDSRAPHIGKEYNFDIRDINDGSYVGNNHAFTNSMNCVGLGRTVAGSRGAINRPHSPRMCLNERHVQTLRADPAAKHSLQRTQTLADFDKQRGRTYDLQARVKSFLNKS